MTNATSPIKPLEVFPESPFFRARCGPFVLDELSSYSHEPRGRPTLHRKVRGGVIPDHPQVPEGAYYVTGLASRNRRLVLRNFVLTLGDRVTPLENAFWWVGIDDQFRPSRVLLIPSWISHQEQLKVGRDAIVRAVLRDDGDDALIDSAGGVITRRESSSFAAVDTTVTDETKKNAVIRAVSSTKGANRFFVHHPIRIAAHSELHEGGGDLHGIGEPGLREFDELLILRQVAHWTLTESTDEVQFTLPDELLFQPGWLNSYELRDASDGRAPSEVRGAAPHAGLVPLSSPAGNSNIDKTILSRRVFSVYFDRHANLVLKYIS